MHIEEELAKYEEAGLDKNFYMTSYRDSLLADSDFRMVSDAPWNLDVWATYRQALRDLPANPDWPNVEFPDPPQA
jgi:hypothetical protein